MTTAKKTPAKKAPARKPHPAATATPDPAEKVPVSKPDAKPETGPVPTGGGPEKQDTSALEQLEAEAAGAGERGGGESVAEEVTAQQARERQEQDDLAAARAGAAMAFGFAETVLKMKFPYVEIPGEQRGQLIEKATPVMRKYGAELPAWLKPYQEEIELGMTVAATGFGVYMQVQQHRREEARQAALEARRRRQAGAAGAERPRPEPRVDLSTQEAPEEADAVPA